MPAAQLAVDAVIAGSMRRAGNTMRVSVQLVSVANDAVLWAEKFDAQSGTALELEDSIAERVATALTLALARDERPPAAQRQTANPDAYEHYIRGRYLISKRTRDALLEAVACMERAIAIDPQFALAHAGLSRGVDPARVARRGLAEPAAARGHAEGARRGRKGAGARRLAVRGARNARPGTVHLRVETRRRASPSCSAPSSSIPTTRTRSTGMPWRSAGSGRFDEALAQIQRALAIDPLAVIVNANVGFLLYRAGRLDEAVAKLRHTVAMEPGFVMTRYRLGLALEALGPLRRGHRANSRPCSPSRARPAGSHRRSRAPARSWASTDEARRMLERTQRHRPHQLRARRIDRRPSTSRSANTSWPSSTWNAAWRNAPSSLMWLGMRTALGSAAYRTRDFPRC